MRTVSYNTHKSSVHHSLLWSVAAIFAVTALLVYLVYTLSLSHLMLLGVFAALIMALVSRFNTDSTKTSHHEASKLVYTDGGTIRHSTEKPVIKTGSIVRDGGSFERAQKSK